MRREVWRSPGPCSFQEASLAPKARWSQCSKGIGVLIWQESLLARIFQPFETLDQHLSRIPLTDWILCLSRWPWSYYVGLLSLSQLGWLCSQIILIVNNSMSLGPWSNLSVLITSMWGGETEAWHSYAKAALKGTLRTAASAPTSTSQLCCLCHVTPWAWHCMPLQVQLNWHLQFSASEEMPNCLESCLTCIITTAPGKHIRR